MEQGLLASCPIFIVCSSILVQRRYFENDTWGRGLGPSFLKLGRLSQIGQDVHWRLSDACMPELEITSQSVSHSF